MHSANVAAIVRETAGELPILPASPREFNYRTILIASAAAPPPSFASPLANSGGTAAFASRDSVGCFGAELLV